MENIQIKYEKQFIKKANTILTAQKEAVINQVAPKKIVAAGFDAEGEAKKLSDEALPLFILLAKEQGDLAAVFAGNADTVFEMTPVMEKYIADSVAKATLSFTKETQEKIAATLVEGINDGESISKLGKRINTLYDELLGVKEPGWRTERLARTEVIKTSNEITEAAYKQTGVVKKKEFFANPTACQFCLSVGGSIIRVGGIFVPKGGKIEGVDGGTRINDYEDVKHPPLHPSCRCTILPVIEDLSNE